MTERLSEEFRLAVGDHFGDPGTLWDWLGLDFKDFILAVEDLLEEELDRLKEEIGWDDPSDTEEDERDSWREDDVGC